MAVPQTPLDRTMTVTVANPTPPTNYPVNYQGTPPTPVGLTPPNTVVADAQPWLFADPLNGAASPQISGKAEADGTEVTTIVGGTTGHSVLGSYTESPNASHPSIARARLGDELVTLGDFSASTGWTLTNGATITTGQLKMDGTGAGTASRTAAVPIVTTAYQVSFNLVATNGSADIRVVVGGSTKIVTPSLTVGTYTTVITSLATDQLVKITTLAGTICTIDDLSIRRIITS